MFGPAVSFSNSLPSHCFVFWESWNISFVVPGQQISSSFNLTSMGLPPSNRQGAMGARNRNPNLFTQPGRRCIKVLPRSVNIDGQI
jgi:hypothetical protein